MDTGIQGYRDTGIQNTENIWIKHRVTGILRDTEYKDTGI